MEEPRAPFFSLIMCLYQVEDYVRRAVESLRAQDFDDWELLVVDDGARDLSVLRALRGAGRDPRVRLIHNPSNLGLPEARNRGLDQARGAYVAFPDAEDIAGPGYLRLAAEAARAYDADIVVEGVVEDHYNRRGDVAYSTERLPRPAVAREGQVSELVLPLAQAHLVGFLFTKFFRRSLVGDLRFETSAPHQMEDFYFTLEMMERARTVAVLEDAPYRFQKHLRHNRQRTLTQGTFLQRHRRVAALQDHQERHGLDTPESRARLGALYAGYIMDELGRLEDPATDVPREERERWVAFLREDPLFQLLVLGTEPTPGLLSSLLHKALSANTPNTALALGHLMGYLKSFGPETYSRAQE